MGRSRMVPRLENEDSNQSKSKRKKTFSSAEVTASPSTGQELKDGKSALYHCNYCNKDLSGRIRMKCVACLDFDLCVECFSVGAELTPHKSNHPYRVMDNLSFPLLCPDWHADEEILLLEGIAMYGFGNWAEVAEFVGTKSKLQCFNHYSAIYMNSPCFPLPDLSHVMGKSREELLAMDTAPIDNKSEFPMAGELNEGSSLSARVKCEESRKEDSVHQTSSSGTAGSISGSTFSGAVKKTSKKPQIKDEIKHGASEAERSFSEKKPRVLGDNDPSMVELSGYNFKRQEFDIEYDNEAEHLLADMEFKDTDSEADRELKLKVLRIYFKRLDERKRRKDFILDRDLLYSDPFEKHLSSEERAICQSFKVFMRFHSRKDHEELLKNLLEEHRIVKRIQELQEARGAGCRTAAESSEFLEQKRKEAQESSKRVKESSQAIPSDTVSNHPKGENDNNPRGDAKKSPRLQGNDNEPSLATSWISSSIEDWDITGFVGADLLSETERRLCCEIRILPSHYLKMADTISVEILKGSVTKKSDVYDLFKVDPIKVDKVYDMVVKKGIAQVD